MKSAKVSDATTRLKLRKRERRQAQARRVLVWIVIVVLLGGFGYLFAFSPFLAVQRISISGISVLTEDQVIAAAQVSTGTPLAMIDPGKVADRLALLAPVAAVTVSREWPNTLQISIEERQPRLAIPLAGGYRLADATGVVFQTVEAAPSGLVVVEAPTGDQELLASVGQVFSALRPATAAKVSRLVAPTRDSIELKFKDGRQVIWGSAEQSDLKSRVLEDLLPLGGKVFDVSAPAFPTRR